VDAVTNPYTMSAGNPPPALTGRDPQLQQWEVLIRRLSAGRNDQSMIVSGLRGVGKTVLLLEFQGIADRAGWITSDPIEVRSDTDFRAELADRAFQALTHLDRRVGLGERARAFAKLLQGFRFGVGADGGVEFSFEASASASTGDLERDLAELFVQLGEVARQHLTGVAFFVDEMQFLKRSELEAVAAAMHRMSQKRLPVALAGTGLPQLPGLIVEAKSYAERLFSYPRLDRLTPGAAREALERPAQEEGVAFEDAALDRMLELSGRYPAFLQAYGREVWNTAPRSPITIEDVRAAEPIVQSKLDEQFFHVRFEKATPTERGYMSAMAALGDGPQPTGQVAGKMGYSRPSGGSVHRDALIKKGLIYSPEHGVVDFTVPHFAAFMRRRYPFAGEHT
jgi:AAA ATPase-like protein